MSNSIQFSAKTRRLKLKETKRYIKHLFKLVMKHKLNFFFDITSIYSNKLAFEAHSLHALI